MELCFFPVSESIQKFRRICPRVQTEVWIIFANRSLMWPAESKELLTPAINTYIFCDAECFVCT
jgi:hypothetical protein